MQIIPGLSLHNSAVLLEKTLIINDLHLGYEEMLTKRGILVPKQQTNQIIKNIKKLLKLKPERIIINGDLKHEFGTILNQEWKAVRQFLTFIEPHVKEIIIVQGNHDVTLKPIILKHNLKLLSSLLIKDTLIVHGDEIVETKAKRIIIGHEHPAITLREGSKWEKYKCFLRGPYEDKEIIVVPSFNPLIEGTDVLKEKLLSPYLKQIKEFEVIITYKEKTLPFGKIKNL